MEELFWCYSDGSDDDAMGRKLLDDMWLVISDEWAGKAGNILKVVMIPIIAVDDMPQIIDDTLFIL